MYIRMLRSGKNKHKQMKEKRTRLLEGNKCLDEPRMVAVAGPRRLHNKTLLIHAKNIRLASAFTVLRGTGVMARDKGSFRCGCHNMDI